MNDAILAAKGPGKRHRLYEIQATNHFDAGMVRMVAKDQQPVNYLDLSGMITALVDDVDAWVMRGVEPPRAQTVKMREVSCPLGSYVALPIANGAMTHRPFRPGTSTLLPRTYQLSIPVVTIRANEMIESTLLKRG